jgi:long-chain acyl-CoA synthetase
MATFYDRFVECAERWPGNVALAIQRHDRLESCTYSELRSMAESVGRWIAESGFTRGSRLAILADNHPRWVAAYLGIIASGCAAVPLDTILRSEQLATLLQDSGASAIFSDAKHLSTLRPAAAEAKIDVVLMDPDRLTSEAGEKTWAAEMPNIFASGPGAFKPVAGRDDDLASLIYTSGTTADPKGVMLTHANFLGEVEAVFNWVDIGPDDALLGVLPLFHVLAQMANLLLPLVKGSRVIYLETINSTELLRALQEQNITAFAVVPQFFYLIHERVFQEVQKRGTATRKIFAAMVAVNRTLGKLRLNAGPILFRKIHETLGRRMRYLVTGGSRFDPVIARKFHDLGIDILQAYGLTETTAAVYATSPTNNVIGSVGQAMKGIEGRIVDPQPAEDGGPAVGEVALRGPVVMKGYWNRPDATAAVLRDGWFYTGDLGYLDAHGNLFLTGRKKEVIVLSSGKNIYPEEIEAHYLKSPFIKELAVVGLRGNVGQGDRLHAVIVPNFDALRHRKVVNAKEVIRYDIEGLSQQVPSSKRITSYEIWRDDLPRTTTRKIKRFEVERRVHADNGRKLAEDSESPTEKPLTAEETGWMERPEVQRGLNILRQAARQSPEKLRPGLNLELDLGFDSMQRIELLSQLEAQLGGNVEESQLATIYSVRDLIEAVLASAAAGEQPAERLSTAGWNTILSEEPTDPEVLALATRPPAFDTFWYPFTRVLQMIARDLFRLRVEGMENLPPHGPFILCSNHQSYIDPVVLGSLLPRNILQNSFAVGTSDIFGQGFMRRLARWIRVIVVDPDVNLIPAMRAGAFGLRHGRTLVLYPEGERSIDGTPRIFKKGAAILSIHLQVPIVPVAIDGFYEAWPRGKKFFQKISPLKMVFGKPISPPHHSHASEEAYEQLTAELKAKIVRMWEQLRASG